MSGNIFFNLLFGFQTFAKTLCALFASAHSPKKPLMPSRIESNLPDSDASPEGGLVQIRAIGFGAAGLAAIADLEKYPAAGLSFVQYVPPVPAGFTQKKPRATHRLHGDLDRWLECAQTVVFIMDGSDAAISHDAISLGKRAKAQGLLTIAVVLGANSDVRPDADQFSDGVLEALAAGTHVSVRLETPKNQMDCDRTAIVLQSLTSGLANLCNLQASINVDYEDVLTVLGNPARLSVGVGTAIGGERALVAAQAALADVRPAVRNPELVQGVLIMISVRQYQLRLSECRIAMNTTRAAFGPDAHCIYGVYCSELPAEKTAGEMNDRIEITIFVTSPMQEVAQH